MELKELNNLRLLPPWHALGRSDLAIDIAESLEALSQRKGSCYDISHCPLPLSLTTAMVGIGKGIVARRF